MKFEERVSKAFGSAATSYHREAVVQQQVAQRLSEEIAPNTNFQNVYEFGAGTGLLSQALESRCSIENWYLNDLSPKLLEKHPFISSKSPELFYGDVQAVSPFEKGSFFDLIASSSTLQWLDKPYPFLLKLKAMLRPKGVLLLSTFGKKNLHELSSITGNSLDYTSFNEWQTFFHDNFSQISLFEESYTLYFPSLMQLLRHLKETGVTQIPKHRKKGYFSSMSSIIETEKIYRKLFATEDNLLPLTYNAIFIVAHI